MSHRSSRLLSCSPVIPPRRSFLALSVLAAAGLPVLAACDEDAAVSPSAGASSGSGDAKGSGTDWQELDAHISGHHVTVRVSPVIRKDESTSIMALELTRAEDDASVADTSVSVFNTGDNNLSLSNYLGPTSIWWVGAGAAGVRLLDLDQGRVWNATDGSGSFLKVAPGEKATSYLSFGKVDADTVTVLVPQTGFTTVSVLDKDSAQKADIDLASAQTELDKRPAPEPKLVEPAAIERYTRTLDGSTSTHTGDEDVTVTLASDVTFASDSAELAPAAEAQLQIVAGQLKQYPNGGTLTIVGHTDDIQDDAYNQTLSEQRANAVKSRLEQLTSLDKWNPTATGKGESEPRVNDTTDEARAANRRVEITLPPTGGTTSKKDGSSASPTTTAGSGSGSLPTPQGTVAKGSEGVTLTSKGTGTSGEVTISLDQVTRTGGFLLGTLTCTVKSGSTGAPLTPLLSDPQTVFGNQRDENRGVIATFGAADGLPLITNTERVFPADYQQTDIDAHLPLTELHTGDVLKGGAVTTVCVVWPDPGGDTVTVDHQGKSSDSSYAYRLTDIPISS